MISKILLSYDDPSVDLSVKPDTFGMLICSVVTVFSISSKCNLFVELLVSVNRPVNIIRINRNCFAVMTFTLDLRGTSGSVGHAYTEIEIHGKPPT